MSPALIDTNNKTRPPSPKPPLPSLSNPNPNPTISSQKIPNYNNNKFMSGFDYTFASQSNHQNLRSNPSNRSVPRLVKVRKQTSKARSRSSIPENQAPVDYNPFLNHHGGGDSSVRVRDESRFQELFEKYNDNQSPRSSTNSEEFEFGKSDDLAFVFGANLNLNEEKNGIDECMMNLNIGKDVNFKSNVKKTNDFVFGSSNNNRNNSNSNPVVVEKTDFKLEEEILKLNIKGVANVDPVSDKRNEFVFGGRRKEAKGLEKNVDLKNSNLPDIMQNLNIKESMNSDTSNVKFQPKVGNQNSFVFGNNGSASSVLPNEMKKLNIDDLKGGNEFEETGGNHVKADTKNVFVFGSMKKDVGSSSRSSIGILPDEMSKLNMGSKIRNVSVSQNTTASTFSAQPKVSSDKLFNDVATGNSTMEPFSFQATKSSKSSSVDALHSDQPNDDSKLRGDSTSSNSFHSANLSFQSSSGSDRSVHQNADSKSSGASTSSYSFHSAGLSFQSPEYMSEEPSAAADEVADKAEFDFATPHMEFTTPMQDVLFSSTTNTFSGLNQKLEFSAKKGAANDTRSKKKKGKTRQSVKVPLWTGQHSIPSESSFQEHAESSGGYSPMDVSPYHETSYADHSSRGASVTSLDAIDEDLIAATVTLDINEDGVVFEESKEESMDNFEKGHAEVFVSGVENGVLRSKTKLDTGNDASVAATERDTRPHSDIQNKGNDKSMEFCFASSSESTNFTFSASNSAQEHASAAKRQYKKKVRQKPGQDSYISTLNSKLQFVAADIPFSPLPGRSSNPVMGQNKQEDSSVYQFMEEKKTETIEVPKVKQDSTTKTSSTAVAHEVCEKWRLRGNQAYANGNLSKAEDHYTRGLNCVPKNETSEACLTALTLCYSNRAAARMSSGRIRAALDDCKKAAEINPDFRKVQVRAANCYLALGEIEDALRVFQSALPPGSDLCLDRKLVIEASNGQQKAERAHEYFSRCGELLRKRTSGDAETALQILAEALLISPYSEKLVEMKAEALLLVRKYEEVIQICEQSLDFADKNSSPSAGGSEGTKNFAARLWRWHLMAKSYFYMGKLEEALSYLEKLEQAESVTLKFGSKTADSSNTLAVTLRELLRHKAAGNEAFQSGRHSEAVEHYTSALSCNLESRPFAAICFCNRAAAFQALGQIADAIADCSFAIALDPNYPKAISRRATLHEMIRDYSHAAIDLQRLVSLLEIQTDEKSNKSGRLSRSTSGNLDLRQAQTRLYTLEEESRKGISLNFYLILGIESTGVASDIKKAYRKSALRHHPDKAAQVLPRSENGDDGVWKEIADVVYKDADRLFKMIGEAYAVLSDPVKRFQYDEEELRFTKRGSGCSTSRTQSDVYNSPYERSDNRRNWQEVRRSYRAHYSQYPDGSRSERYF